ncbi:hypothetical protein FRC07_013514, partial [Ceratobasidium sp. 392]
MLKVPRALSKLIGWPISRPPIPLSTITQWIERRQHPAYLNSAGTRSLTVRSSLLNEDVLLRIVCYLTTSRDKLALASVCRWHYLALKHTPYTYLVITQDVQLKPLTTQLTTSEGRRNCILHLDISFPSLFKPVQKSQDENEAHYSREMSFTEEVFRLLKLCRCLKSLYINNAHYGYVRWETLSAYMHDSYPFSLKSLSLTQSIDGTVDFVRDQTQLVQLVLFSSARTKNPDPSSGTELQLPPPIVLPHLKVLWATPRWAKLMLSTSSVESFGLLHDGNRADERHNLRTLIDTLVDDGGHPTVHCLTLSYEDFLWDHQTVGLDRYGAAFPNATKLCVTLPGIGPGRI